MKVPIIGKSRVRKEIATRPSGKHSRQLPGLNIAEDEKLVDTIDVVVTYGSTNRAIKELSLFAQLETVADASVAVKVDYELENFCFDNCYSLPLQYF